MDIFKEVLNRGNHSRSFLISLIASFPSLSVSTTNQDKNDSMNRFNINNDINVELINIFENNYQ